MVNLINWLYFYFIKISIVNLFINLDRMVGLVINRAILIKKKITNDFFNCFCGQK